MVKLIHPFLILTLSKLLFPAPDSDRGRLVLVRYNRTRSAFVDGEFEGGAVPHSESIEVRALMFHPDDVHQLIRWCTIFVGWIYT